jgi:transglutaminase/protease-like cytokinesis protein 3
LWIDLNTLYLNAQEWTPELFVSPEPGMTKVQSTADEILRVGGGVCQDFAHLTIGVLRLAGIPARYVSGYLASVAKAGMETKLNFPG